MRARPALNALAIALVMLMAILAVSCKHYRQSVNGSQLDVSLTEAKSPEEIENMVRTILAEEYSSTNIAKGYTIYQVTNGTARWVFAKVYNAPRGLSMFNLYCYELETPEFWPLRAYVPLNAHYYTNSDDWDLTFQIDHEYVKVAFRGRVIFTGISKLGLTDTASKR